MQRLIGALVLLASLAVGWYWMAYQNFIERPLDWPDEGMVLTVERGTNLRMLTEILHKRGVLQQPQMLYWHARYRGLAHKIRAGEYAVPRNATPDALLQILTEGKSIAYQLTLLEGWNFKQVMAAVRQNPVLKQTLNETSPNAVMAAVGYPGLHPEGRFFPDTYAFPRGTTDQEFLARAAKRMEQQLTDAWAKRDVEHIAVKTPDEALILASIIEKETGAPQERPEISGVFTRRLKKGMKLQTDPTVIYGMGDSYQGNIRRKDLRAPTPYNTYVIKGLPPTPIAMPGRAAIDAALHPAPGKSLYFVSKGDGTHVFSSTLKAHNAAVRKYQLKR